MKDSVQNAVIWRIWKDLSATELINKYNKIHGLYTTWKLTFDHVSSYRIVLSILGLTCQWKDFFESVLSFSRQGLALYTALTSPKKDETAIRCCICWFFPNSYSHWFTDKLLLLSSSITFHKIISVKVASILYKTAILALKTKIKT